MSRVTSSGSFRSPAVEASLLSPLDSWLLVPLWLAEFPEADRAKASEAVRLYEDAVKLLDRLVEMKAEYCKAVYGFFPANSDGDNIRIGDVLLPVLRQQAKKEEGVYKSLADYVMPISGGRTDYVGFSW